MADNAVAAMTIREQLGTELERDEDATLGFDLAVQDETGPGVLWISSDGDGDPEDVVQFVLRCAAAFDLRGTWGFCWSYTCSRPRLDGFGSGAQIVDLTRRRSGKWVDLAEWVLLQDDDQETSGEACQTAPVAANGMTEAAT